MVRCQWCQQLSLVIRTHPKMALFPETKHCYKLFFIPSRPLLFTLAVLSLFLNMSLFFLLLMLFPINPHWPSFPVQDWVGVFSDEGVAQRSLLITLSSPLHPSQPALPPVTLCWSAEAGAIAGQATVSYINTHKSDMLHLVSCFGWTSQHKEQAGCAENSIRSGHSFK